MYRNAVKGVIRVYPHHWKTCKKVLQEIEETYKNPVVSVFLTVGSPFWKSWVKKQLKKEGMK